MKNTFVLKTMGSFGGSMYWLEGSGWTGTKSNATIFTKHAANLAKGHLRVTTSRTVKMVPARF